jgi:hypothetical protein
MAVAVLEVMLPVPVVLEVTDMLVNATVPKSASAACEQLLVHTPGFSVITSALVASGAELVITVENVQPAVLSMTSSVHSPPDNSTDAVIELPGDTGYCDGERVTMYPPFTLASPYISYHA